MPAKGKEKHFKQAETQYLKKCDSYKHGGAKSNASLAIL